jgi:DNA end-binding protein Ku
MRTVWKGILKLSLVTIPIKLFPATSSSSLKFNQIHNECQSRIKSQRYCPHCGREVKNEEIVKGYAYEKDKYVIINEEDFSKVELETTKSINILQFVDEDRIDPIYFDRTYFVIPDGPIAMDGYILMREAMKERGRVAISKIVLSGKENLAAIRAKDNALVMSTLYYHNEVKSAGAFDELKEKASIGPADLKLAKQLVDNVSGEFDLSEFRDEYREKLLEIIKAKVAGEDLVVAPQVEVGKVINLMEALKKSVAQTTLKRKPMARAQRAKKVAKVEPKKAAKIKK